MTAQFGDWEDDDDEKAVHFEDDDEEEGRVGGGDDGEGGGAAIAFAIIFALAFAASAATNLHLYRKYRDATDALARVPSPSSSTYRAPLRQAGEPDSNAMTPA